MTARATPPNACGAALHEQYPELRCLVVEDALYANAPQLRQITGDGWKYVLNVKPDSHESLFKQCAGRRARGDVVQYLKEPGLPF